MSYQYFVIGL